MTPSFPASALASALAEVSGHDVEIASIVPLKSKRHATALVTVQIGGISLPRGKGVLPARFVAKHFDETSKSQLDSERAAIDAALAAGLAVPRPLLSLGGKAGGWFLLLEEIEGENACDAINGPGPESNKHVVMRAVATWLARFHVKGGLVHGDANLRNFLYTPSGACGLDFEAARKGDHVDDILEASYSLLHTDPGIFSSPLPSICWKRDLLFTFLHAYLGTRHRLGVSSSVDGLAGRLVAHCKASSARRGMEGWFEKNDSALEGWLAVVLVPFEANSVEFHEFEPIGHRGIEGLARGNSMEGFHKAIELGLPAIEFDVRRTKDGALVVFHDPAVTCNKKVKTVAKLTLEELRSCAGARGGEIPTLDAVLDACGGKIKMQVELKEMGVEDDMVAALKARGLVTPDVAVSSFNLPSLERLVEINAGFEPRQLVFLLRGTLEDPSLLSYLLNAGIGAISLPALSIEPKHVVIARRAGLRVIAWGLKEKEKTEKELITVYRRMLDLDLDGFTCARPDIVSRLLKERQRS